MIDTQAPQDTGASALDDGAQHDGQSRVGWFRAMRSREAIELIAAAPNAFILAYMIAYRGQYRDGYNRHNLALGEALLGDYENCGMTAQEYRTAKGQLENWQFATFRATNKGTVGKLIDTRLFAIFRLESNDQNNKRVTSEQQTGNNRVTTTKNIRPQEPQELKEGEARPPVEMWKLRKDRKEARDELTRERSKPKPDVGIIQGLIAELASIKSAMREYGQANGKPQSRPTTDSKPVSAGTAASAALSKVGIQIPHEEFSEGCKLALKAIDEDDGPRNNSADFKERLESLKAPRL